MSCIIKTLIYSQWLILNKLNAPIKLATAMEEYADVDFALKGNLWLSIWLATPPAVLCWDQDTVAPLIKHDITLEGITWPH